MTKDFDSSLRFGDEWRDGQGPGKDEQKPGALGQFT